MAPASFDSDLVSVYHHCHIVWCVCLIIPREYFTLDSENTIVELQMANRIISIWFPRRLMAKNILSKNKINTLLQLPSGLMLLYNVIFFIDVAIRTWELAKKSGKKISQSVDYMNKFVLTINIVEHNDIAKSKYIIHFLKSIPDIPWIIINL